MNNSTKALFTATLMCFFWLGTSQLYAQQNLIMVNGTVLKAKTKEAVPNAGVFILGSKTGTMTNEEGNFRISIKSSDTLQIKAIGFKPSYYVAPIKNLAAVNIRILMEEDSIVLKEIQIEISGRPSEEQIQKALRNIKRPEPSLQVKNPALPYLPKVEPAPEPLRPTISSPLSLFYEQFSKEGQQRRKLEEIKQQLYQTQLQLERDRYNRFFKDNRGYE